MKNEGNILISKDFFPKSIQIDLSRIFPVMVVATMSSGKSTLVNALFGMDILPSQNAACTQKIYAVLDDDKIKKPKVYLTKQDGNTFIVEENVSEALQKANQDSDINTILISGQIKGVLNTDKALLLIDTPGPNNSEDLSHEAVMKNALEKLKGGVLLYLINATQMGISDDCRTLQLIKKYKKENPDINLLFVVNKVDALDFEKESIKELMQNTKTYLEDNGIENPNIIPVSALAANLFQKALNGEEMTRNQYRDFLNCYELFESKDQSMTSYVVKAGMLHNSEMIHVRGKEYVRENLTAALDNTGIPYLERYIQEAQILSGEKIDVKISVAQNLEDETESKVQSKVTGSENDRDILHELDRIFAEIKEKNLPQFKEREDVFEKYEEVKSRVFNVNVIAPMSSGKSTLINSILHTKLLPVKNEAMTAVIGNILDSESITNSIIREKREMVVYVMNATQFGIWDDKKLLYEISKEMKYSEKQFRDRFLFVINKCDELDEDRGETVAGLLKDVTEYLEIFGIDNPILIPTSARLALLIRKEQKGEMLTRQERRELDSIEDFVEQPLLHFEKYAVVNLAILKKLEEKAEQYHLEEESWNLEALIHTGVPVLEEVIKEYIEKNMYSIKMKSIVDVVDDMISILKGIEVKSISCIMQKLDQVKKQMEETQFSENVEE